MDKKITTRLGYLTAVTLGFFMASPSAHAQWDWELGGELSIIHTDNLRLVESPLEESDTVFVVRPIIALTSEGDRIDADIRYEPEAYFYDNASDSDEVYHVFDAQVTTTLVRDSLFLALGATNYQTMLSPDAVFPTTNLPVTGNRVDSTVLEARPYWQQNLGFAQVTADVSYVDTQYDETTEDSGGFIQNNVVKSGSFNLDNISQQSGIAWGLDYSYLRAEYELSVPYDYQTASANLGYWFNGNTRIFVEGGLESAYDNPLDPALEDERWEAGFQYAPNARLNVEIAAGERTFGSTVRGDISYRLRRGDISLTYSESPTTRAEIGPNRRPFSDTDSLDQILDRPGEADRFIARRGELVTQIELTKSDMTLRIFSEEREQRTDEVGTPIGDEQYSGVAFRWSWRVGTKSTFAFDADFARREELNQSDLTESDLTRVGVDFTYELSQRLSVVLFADQADESSDDGTGRNYTENQVGLSLRADFQ